MIGTAISAGIGAAGSLFGGFKNARQAHNQKRLLEETEAKEQAWYDKNYNQDATQRADSQRLLTMTADSIRKRNQSAAGAQAVAGGTTASMAATRELNNNAMAQTASNINAQAQARKDTLDSQHMENQQRFAQQKAQIAQQQQAGTAAAIQGLAQAATAGIAIDEMNEENKRFAKNNQTNTSAKS